jgi:hypothetical protein
MKLWGDREEGEKRREKNEGKGIRREGISGEGDG